MGSSDQSIEQSQLAYEQAASGPRVLFFSGGTALTSLSRVLINYTHNSIHIISAFDSGGSSAALRYYFDMPAVGDIRSRLIALTDINRPECIAARDLLSYRLSYIGSDSLLEAELRQIASGQHSLHTNVDAAVAHQICDALECFLAHLPEGFQLRGASIGNLVIAGRYIQQPPPLATIITEFRQWLGVLGEAHLVVDESYHLVAAMADGSELIGQHRITGKECEPINSAVKQLQLSRSALLLDVAKPKISVDIAQLITSAELICYPPGSFYTSLIATLLPQGVVEAISSSDAPKVFIPNLGSDPEQFGLDMVGSLRQLIDYLGGRNTQLSKLLNYIIVDPRIGVTAIATLTKVLEPMHIQLLCLPEQLNYHDGYYDPDELAKALTTLAVG